MAVQDYELLLRVRTDLMEALSGLSGLSDKLGEGDSAAQKLGESADQASERIRKMVQASQDQVATQYRANASIKQTAELTASIGRSFDQQTAAAKRSGQATAAEATAFNAAVMAKVRAVELLNAAFAGNIKSAKGAAAAEVALDEAMAIGAITSREQAAYIDRLSAAQVKNAVATEAAGAAMKISGGTARELGVILGELARGNTARLQGSLITLGNTTGATAALFTPLALVIGAVVAELGVFGYAAAQTALENDKLNKSIQSTGNYAGQTVSSLNTMASRITTANGSLAASREALSLLVASGKVGGQALESMGQAAVDMAELTGQSTEKAAQSVLSMFDGTTQSLIKANEQYHFLTTAIYDQITALEAQGDTQAAMDVAARAFHEAATQRLEAEQAQLSGLARAWQTVTHAVKGYWEQFKTGASLIAGTASLEDQVFALMGQKEGAQSGNPFTFASWSPKKEAELQAKLAELERQKQAAADEQTRAQLNTDAVSAAADVDRLGQSLDRAKAKQAELNKLGADYLKLWKGADPNDERLKGVQAIVGEDGGVSFTGGMYDKLKADIEKRYAEKKPREKSDNGALAAQQQLIKLLNDEQGAIDPVAKAWSTYNDKVQQATALADKAKTAKGANVQAINAERDAVIELAARVRDNALAEQAEKDRTAFERLRASLTKLDDTKLDKVTVQIKQLRGYLDRGTISQGEYDDTARDIVQNSLTKLPSYKGISGAVGGPFGELNKVNNQQAELEKIYKTNLDLLNQYHEQRLISDQAFTDAESKLFQQHSELLQQIDDDRSRVMMLGITQSLSQGAEAIRQGFGEQSNAYRAAFALSKGAAIAQASINMYMNISQAMAKGWPQNIPLIAQATGEGLALIGQIRAVTTGFAQGGYTGPGGRNEPAGVVHKGEVVWSQDDIARAGGVGVVEAMRLGLAGYANGGYMASSAGFPEIAQGKIPSWQGGPASSINHNRLRVYVLQNEEQLVERLASHPKMEKAIVVTAGQNQQAIQAEWQS